LIFLDINVISETLRKTPNPALLAWLVRNDAELALPTVTIDSKARIAEGRACPIFADHTATCSNMPQRRAIATSTIIPVSSAMV